MEQSRREIICASYYSCFFYNSVPNIKIGLGTQKLYEAQTRGGVIFFATQSGCLWRRIFVENVFSRGNEFTDGLQQCLLVINCSICLRFYEKRSTDDKISLLISSCVCIAVDAMVGWPSIISRCSITTLSTAVIHAFALWHQRNAGGLTTVKKDPGCEVIFIHGQMVVGTAPPVIVQWCNPWTDPAHPVGDGQLLRPAREWVSAWICIAHNR